MTTPNSSGIRSVRTLQLDPVAAAGELADQLADLAPRLVVVFSSHRHDGALLSKGLRDRLPEAEVIGCTTAGEFTQAETGTGAVTALGLGESKVKRVASALAKIDGGDVAASVRAAAGRLEASLGVELRTVDPSRYVGLVLIDGLHMSEEQVNGTLGSLAPMVSFVGASAGDDLEFVSTRVYRNGESTDDGAVLVLLEAAVPFSVGKSCSFVPKKGPFAVTRADAANRVVYELAGHPVLEVYAEALGTTADRLDASTFMTNPLGLLIDNEPWIRSPQRALPDGGLKFYCEILEGMDVHVMQSTDLVADTRAAIGKIRKELGGEISGGIAFNCILRRLELDAKGQHEPFLEIFEGSQVAGFHTYGESWLGHINQTLTGLWFA